MRPWLSWARRRTGALALEIGQHEAGRLRRQPLGAGDFGVAQARRLGERLQHRILGERHAEIGQRLSTARRWVAAARRKGRRVDLRS